MKDDFNLSCKLFKTTETAVDGVLTITETSRTVFCALLSNVHTIKTEAATTGLGYEIKLKLSDISEYDGEKFVEFQGERYEITRTYQDGYMLELTCVRGVR